MYELEAGMKNDSMTWFDVLPVLRERAKTVAAGLQRMVLLVGTDWLEAGLSDGTLRPPTDEEREEAGGVMPGNELSAIWVEWGAWVFERIEIPGAAWPQT